MFTNKKLEKKIAKLEMFERGVGKVIEGYFKKHEKEEVRYSMDSAVDEFWHFVKSVDDRISSFEKAIADGELVSKEWHDEQVLQLSDENKALKEELAKELDEHQKFCETAQRKIDEKNAVIKAQEKEIKELVRISTRKGGKK